MSERGATTLSAGNPRIKRLRRLVRNRRARSQERAFVVEGPVLVAEALASDLTVSEVFVGATADFPADVEVPDPPGAGSVPTFIVDDEVLCSVLGPKNPRPVAAIVDQPTWNLDQIGGDGHLVAAVGVADPGNLGTIIRTAEGSGADAVLVVGPSVDPFAPKVVRSTAGAILRLPVVAVESAEAVRSFADDQGRPMVAADISDTAVAYDLYPLAHAILMVGNEPHGLSPEVVERCDAVVMIPLTGGLESLNVAAASAVLCFEAARQRRVGPGQANPTPSSEPRQSRPSPTKMTAHDDQ